MSLMMGYSQTSVVDRCGNRAPRVLWRIIALALALAAWLGEWQAPPAWAALPPGMTHGVIVRPASGEPTQRFPEDPDVPISTGFSQPGDPDTGTGAPLLLPDLQTLPPSDLEIRLLSRGRRVLRLANTVWNSGQGPLELVGALNFATQRTRVVQRVYASDTTVHDHLVGEFVWHPGHDHWHVEDFVLYQLWSVTPQGELERVVASSAKLSYCLIDTDVVDQEHPGFTARRHYRGCGRTLQGLSVGWGDKYDSFLDGQSLDLTGLTDGVYVLVSRTNPTAALLEADYTNNTAVMGLNIVGDRVEVVPMERAFLKWLCYHVERNKGLLCRA